MRVTSSSSSSSPMVGLVAASLLVALATVCAHVVASPLPPPSSFVPIVWHAPGESSSPSSSSSPPPASPSPSTGRILAPWPPMPAPTAEPFLLNRTTDVNSNTNLTAWDKTTSLRYLMYSYAAYCSEASQKAWNCKWCKNVVTWVATIFDQKTDTRGYVVYDHTYNAVIVAFRGSSSLTNWIEDIKFWKDKTPFDGVANAFVAQGFYECYVAVAFQVQKAVRKALSDHPSAGLFVTGHSLGGAMATLAAFDLAQASGIASREVYTFGSPRVGTTGFATAYANRVATTWRMTNHQDIVPHLPPKNFDFFHVSNEVFEIGDVYKVCTGGEDKSCADSQLAISAYDHLHYMGQAEGC